jgi:selenide,water dikinase
VHALTDVTGFGLAGHALELARGAGVRRADRLARRAAAGRRARAGGAGFVTGASGRNWAGYGDDVALPAGFAEDRALLTDPQTSGGLLVACAPDTVGAVMDIFRRQGFGAAAEIGEVQAGQARLRVR